MTDKKNLFILFTAVIVVLVIFGCFIILNPSRNKQQVVPTTEKSATGNIDDAINAIINDSDMEGQELIDEEQNAGLVDMDAQEISNLGQSYNENEL